MEFLAQPLLSPMCDKEFKGNFREFLIGDKVELGTNTYELGIFQFWKMPKNHLIKLDTLLFKFEVCSINYGLKLLRLLKLVHYLVVVFYRSCCGDCCYMLELLVLSWLSVDVGRCMLSDRRERKRGMGCCGLGLVEMGWGGGVELGFCCVLCWSGKTKMGMGGSDSIGPCCGCYWFCLGLLKLNGKQVDLVIFGKW